MDMQRTPPTTEPLSGNFLDEILVWILNGEIEWEKERQAFRRHTKPTDVLGGARYFRTMSPSPTSDLLEQLLVSSGLSRWYAWGVSPFWSLARLRPCLGP
jgi:hypothetical protein